MSDKILEVYKKVASSFGWIVDDKGFISEIIPGADDANPVLSGQHRLVMPYPDQLKVHDWSNRYAFHPFLQSVVGGDSPVMEKLRSRSTLYMNFIVGFLFTSLASLANNKKEHASFTPEQAAYLKPFSDSDEQFLTLLRHIMGLGASFKNNREYVRFTLVKGRTWQGAKRARVAAAHFPLYEAVTSDDFNRVFCGLKMRIKDVRMIRQMYEHIFPAIDDRSQWERGSDNNSIAPSIETLLNIYARTAICANKVVDDFGDKLIGGEYVRIPLDWIDEVNDLASLLPEIRKIPQLNGNVARSRVETEDSEIPQVSVNMDDPLVVTGEVATTRPSVQQNAETVVRTIPRFGSPMGTKPAAVETKAVQASDASNIDASRFKPYTPSKIVQPAQALQEQRQQVLNQRKAMAGNQNDVELPPGSRMIGTVLYVPAPKTSNGAVPNGARIHEGVLMVPYANPAQTGTMLGGVNTGMGVTPMANQQQIINGLLNGTIDPSQVPGIDEATADTLRGNPILIQNYVQTMMGNQAAIQNNRAMQQQQAVPRYLQEAIAMGQANTMAQQTGMLGNYGNGSSGAGIIRFGGTGNSGFGF